MKKIILSCFLISSILQAQFTFKGKINNYSDKRVVIKLNKAFDDILVGNTTTDSKGNFSIPIKEKYIGAINVSLFDAQQNLNLLSDNTNIDFTYTLTSDRNIVINNPGNKINETYQNYNNYILKKYSILPELSAIMNIYKPNEEFYSSLNREIQNINTLQQVDYKSFPYLTYYINTLELIKKSDNTDASNLESNQNLIANHFINAGEEFETDGLGKTLLYSYLKTAATGASNKNDWTNKIDSAIQKLLDGVGEDTNRGQEILAATINFLNAYSLEDLANKYLNKAESLTCEITPELKKAISINSNIKVGKKIPNIKFTHKLDNKYTSLYDIKTKYKLVMVWASWCGHCQQELPAIKLFYENFKKSGGEIIGLSADYNKEQWGKSVKELPWLNDSDFLYWDSKFVKELNISGTPTLFLLDKNNQILKITSKISEISNLIKN